MDCVDCHNRPSHILQSPDRSVDVALADGRLDASLPFIKQQGVAALTAAYADREQALRGIDSALRGYYREDLSAGLRGQAASDRCRHRLFTGHLQPLFLSGDESPVGYILHQRAVTFSSRGASAAMTASIRAWTARSFPPDCGDCHTILQQGKTGSLRIRQGAGRAGFPTSGRHWRRVGGNAVQFVPYGRNM